MNKMERKLLGLKGNDCFTSRKIETIVSTISNIQRERKRKTNIK